jgi:hypothetical protein
MDTLLQCVHGMTLGWMSWMDVMDGRVPPQAWHIYSDIVGETKWENMSASKFWNEVLTNDSLANLRPLFHSVAEIMKMLCCSLTDDASIHQSSEHFRTLGTCYRLQRRSDFRKKRKQLSY